MSLRGVGYTAQRESPYEEENTNKIDFLLKKISYLQAFNLFCLPLLLLLHSTVFHPLWDVPVQLLCL